MCTSGTTDILVVGTNLGSLILYDLKNIESNPFLGDQLNYMGLLSTIKDYNEMPPNKQQAYFNKFATKF